VTDQLQAPANLPPEMNFVRQNTGYQKSLIPAEIRTPERSAPNLVTVASNLSRILHGFILSH